MLERFKQSIRMLKQGKPDDGQNGAKITPRLFIHIPKTAGTSFRSAAESRFGASRVLRDYGPESDETSQAVKKHVYSSGDPAAIANAISEENAVLVSGHIPITKYKDVFQLADTAALIRNPVDQVVSHYRHMVRHYGHRGSLIDFAHHPNYRNVQSKYIGMIDPALIGLVGLTESYRVFLNILNEQWNWKLPHRRRNVGNRFGFGGLRLSADERTEVERLNDMDAALYRRVKHIFSNRIKAYRAGHTSDIRGGITSANSERGVSGWALDINSYTPVKVEILVDGQPVAHLTCDQPVPDFSDWLLPCGNRAGFSLPGAPLNANGLVELRDPVHGFVLDRRKAPFVR